MDRMSERPVGELFVSGHGGDLSALFNAVVEQPASTAAALKHIQVVKPDSQLVRAAQELAVAAAKLEAAGPEDREPLAERCVQVAVELNRDGKTDEAAVVLSLAVRLGAEGEAVDALARTIATGVIAQMCQAMNDGDDSGAAQAADILKGLSPGLSEAWATSGRLALKRGQARSARADLERAVELSPGSQNTLLNLARAQTADGAFNDSVTTLFRLLRVADGSDGRYRPLAVTELETVFHVAAQAAAKAPDDSELLQTCFSAMENIADGVSGNVIEYSRARAIARGRPLALSVSRLRSGRVGAASRHATQRLKSSRMWRRSGASSVGSGCTTMRTHRRRRRSASHWSRTSLRFAMDLRKLCSGRKTMTQRCRRRMRQWRRPGQPYSGEPAFPH